MSGPEWTTSTPSISPGKPPPRRPAPARRRLLPYPWTDESRVTAPHVEISSARALAQSAHAGGWGPAASSTGVGLRGRSPVFHQCRASADATSKSSFLNLAPRSQTRTGTAIPFGAMKTCRPVRADASIWTRCSFSVASRSVGASRLASRRLGGHEALGVPSRVAGVATRGVG